MRRAAARVAEAQLRNQFVQFVALTCAALGAVDQVHFKSPVWDDARGLRLLLVDAALAMSLVLESDGYEVRVAHEAGHALKIADEFKPEIVLLDLGLPGMDGSQLAQEMRRRASTAGALLIAVTGYGQAADRLRTQQAGFDHHLVKPVSSEEIQRLIAGRFPNGQR